MQGTHNLPVENWCLDPVAGDSRTAKFVQLTKLFCEITAQEGLAVKPFDGPGPRYFVALNSADKDQVLAHFADYVELCAAVLHTQPSIRNDSNHFWQALKRFNLRPRSDLFSYVQNHYLIEVYNKDHVQIFRNWKFFEACSYSLDELLCRPWWELFKRDQAVFQFLAGIASEILAGDRNKTYLCRLGQQTVDEISSSRQLRAVVRERFVSPLYDKYQQPAGYVHAVEVLSCVSQVDGLGLSSKTATNERNGF